jgi:alpha-glucosidase (family GH31 glycosyl hydrolase)
MDAAGSGPYDSRQWYCADGIEGYRPLEPGPGGLLNFFDDATGAWWYDQHRHLVDEGVDAFWLDLNEPEGVGFEITFPHSTWPASGTLDGESARNAFALAQQRAFAAGDASTGRRPFVLSRAGCAGSQRAERRSVRHTTRRLRRGRVLWRTGR